MSSKIRHIPFRDHRGFPGLTIFEGPTSLPTESTPSEITIPLYMIKPGRHVNPTTEHLLVSTMWCHGLLQILNMGAILSKIGLPKARFRIEVYDCVSNLDEVVKHAIEEREERNIAATAIGLKRYDHSGTVLNLPAFVPGIVDLQNNKPSTWRKTPGRIAYMGALQTAILKATKKPVTQLASTSLSVRELERGARNLANDNQPESEATIRPSGPQPQAVRLPNSSLPMHIQPLSIYRGRRQPYHQFALVPEQADWMQKGLTVIRFGLESSRARIPRIPGGSTSAEAAGEFYQKMHVTVRPDGLVGGRHTLDPEGAGDAGTIPRPTLADVVAHLLRDGEHGTNHTEPNDLLSEVGFQVDDPEVAQLSEEDVKREIFKSDLAWLCMRDWEQAHLLETDLYKVLKTRIEADVGDMLGVDWTGLME